jgi:Flp pilus assembly protein TadD
MCFRYKNNDFDKAVALYSEAIEHDPTNVLLYTNKAAALMGKKSN